MASRPVLLKALFSQFTAFLRELQTMYPEDPDFPAYQTTLAALEYNPLLVAKYVKEHVVDRHADKIAARDETFFLNHSYEDVAEDVSLDVVQKLKGYVSGMDQKTKDVVWQYVEVISKLALKCLE
jgi:hypothetical protein